MSDERLTALVLAADDDEDILELVKIVLEEDGYQVVTAPDGKKALAMATEMIPDLCVFDVMMPKMDGCEATRQMRADERTRDIPILLLSARTQWEAVMKGKEAGADEYITKPFVPGRPAALRPRAACGADASRGGPGARDHGGRHRDRGARARSRRRAWSSSRAPTRTS